MQAIDRMLTRLGSAAIGLTIGASAVNSCIYDVDGGRMAVMFNRFPNPITGESAGIQRKVVGEGTHIKVPFFQDPKIFDVRTRPRAIPTVTGTKDLQMVNITLRLLSRPSKDMLPIIYQRLGLDYDERILPSIANEVLKSVVAQYDAEELLKKREAVSREVKDQLIQRAADFHIVLEDIAITHLTFGKEFASAIEKKQVAQQEAERQKFVVAKAEQEKKAMVIRAEGEAEAAKLISEALKKGQGLVNLRRLEAARDITNTIAKSKNVVFIPSSGGG
eukprot:CAMPEP_0169445360 /NCGR_PEP_ID=MMETSP1042-20121227/10400_1 /TAXON_ID=464988 /ORGANISM="Hemiselmis andersenii, Strain CCMP1180" /LENGTH=275 /DNA_ID=CAMNT_0009556755 /DNA_START=73 /DNA_END=897 /DNA_ORIENTATION=-